MNFKDLMIYVKETYGTPYGVGEEENILPDTVDDLEDLNDAWFICPECGEPIYYSDWKDELDENICPVCEFDFSV